MQTGGGVMRWDSQTEVLRLSRDLAFGSCHRKNAAYPEIHTFDAGTFSRMAPVRVAIHTVNGDEHRSIEAILATSLVWAVRDFTDSEGAINSATDGVPVACWLGAIDRSLRRSMRRQLRRTLDAPRFAAADQGRPDVASFPGESASPATWPCPYCGETTKRDEGFARREHLSAHPEALPTRGDDGCTASIQFARGSLLVLLAALVRGPSWRRHREYFAGTSALDPLERHFAVTDAGVGLEAASAYLGWPVGEFPSRADWLPDGA